MRELRSQATTSLAGSLLLAHPALRDPNFRRSVILMSTHGADGAMGVVLNRPLGKRLGDLNVDFALGPLASVPIFGGGPVQTEQLLLAAWHERDDGFQLQFGLEPDKAGQLTGEPRTQVRAFFGYSGWSAGQLETEIDQNTWIVTSVPPNLLEQPLDAELWRAILSRQGGDWKLLAGEPDDPTRN
jgi:putative transcriptional regulator